jgi:hypothetical protein
MCVDGRSLLEQRQHLVTHNVAAALTAFHGYPFK